MIRIYHYLGQKTVLHFATIFICLLIFHTANAQNKKLAGKNLNKNYIEKIVKNAPSKKTTKSKEQQLSNRERLERAVLNEARLHKIDPLLIWALIEQESQWKAGAVSPKGARGIMQLMPGTAKRWGVKNSHNIEEAVRGGTNYLVWLIDKFNGNVALGLAGYNAGEGAVEAYLPGNPDVNSYVGGSGRRWYVSEDKAQRAQGIPQNEETINYVNKIAENYRRLKAMQRNGEKIFLTINLSGSKENGVKSQDANKDAGPAEGLIQSKSSEVTIKLRVKLPHKQFQ